MIRTLGNITLVLLAVVAPVLAADKSPAFPTTGQPVPALAPLDDAVTQFMAARHIDAGVIAVSRGDEADGGSHILYQRGFGWLDAAHTKPVPVDTPMRLASVCKPITAAAVRKLIRDGKLTLDTRVFPLLNLTPPPGSHPDPRLDKITVKNLLEHRGGWDRAAAFDPMFHDKAIRAYLHIDRVPDAHDIIRYMLAQPLQFDPGSRYAYSNFGYCVLGRVIEKVTGEPYIDYIRQAIAKPLHMDHLALARTDPAKRDPAEPNYHVGKFPLYTERMDAHGGMIDSAADLCRFLAAYRIDGEPRRKSHGFSYAFYGAMPGTFTMVRQRPDGLNIAVLFNNWPPDFEKLMHIIDAAADSIKDWPTAKKN